MPTFILPSWYIYLHGMDVFLLKLAVLRLGCIGSLDPFKLWNQQIQAIYTVYIPLSVSHVLQMFFFFRQGSRFSRFCWPARAGLAQEEGVLANLLGRLVVTDELETLFFDWLIT